MLSSCHHDLRLFYKLDVRCSRITLSPWHGKIVNYRSEAKNVYAISPTDPVGRSRWNESRFYSKCFGKDIDASADHLTQAE